MRSLKASERSDSPLPRIITGAFGGLKATVSAVGESLLMSPHCAITLI